MGARRSCAACGRQVRGKGIEVSVWDGEDLAAVVCSEGCRAAYEAGHVGGEAPPKTAPAPGPEGLPRIAAMVVVGLAAAVELVRAFLADPSNVLTFVLAPNQILLLDNWSVLHGRTAFADGDRRLLNRINFLADSKYASDDLVLGFPQR